MTDLIARLESGDGADRELDEAIWCLDNEKPEMGGYYGWKQDSPGCWLRPGAREFEIEYFGVPRYTSSLDAAISLVEKMLPPADGWQFTIYHDGAQVSRSSPPSLFWGRSKSRPRSLLIALLKALVKQ